MSGPRSSPGLPATTTSKNEATFTEHTDLAPQTTRSLTPKFDGVAQRPAVNPNGFLTAPFSSTPMRPLSPDNMSEFSMLDYDTHQPLVDPLPLPSDSTSTTAPTGFRAKLRALWIRNLGLVYMLVAQFFGTLMNVTTRLLEVEGNGGRGFHPFQILFARMSITFLLASAYMWWKRTPHFPLGAPEVRRLLLARGAAGFFGVFGMYYSLLYLPLADATVITFLAPGLACWACSILLKEPFSRTEQIGGVISLLGVVLIARPTSLFHHGGSDLSSDGSTADAGAELGKAVADYDQVTPMQRLSAVAVALVGVLGAATAYTTLRWIGKRAHPLISVNYFSGWSTMVSIVAQLAVPGVGFLLPTHGKDWGYLIFLGSCGFIMQYLLASALAYERSSRATNFTYTQMLFALTFDKLVFKHSPGVLSIIGSSLILGPAIVVAMQKAGPPGGAPGANKYTSEGGADGGRVGEAGAGDEESRVGLMSGELDDEEPAGAGEADEVPMRTLR